MSPGSSTESYPAFAHIGLRENPGKNLNQGLDRPASCWPHAHMPKQRWTIIQPEWRYRVVSTMILPAVIAGIRNQISLPIVAPQVHHDAGVSVCVSVMYGMSGDDEDEEGRRGNLMPACSLLSNSAERAARLNVPVRWTNHYQQ
ncbi:hypothetical protein ANN_25994 [Periplaneta americana]|uniref:Uncharacterized protein n=1 Tax=Periplaneta americana TaxID=6978 RepID=A0ABQ8S4P8_PERAM|nr:hypothetical protein ANN_25994 [Periplaneta americana]